MPALSVPLFSFYPFVSEGVWKPFYAYNSNLISLDASLSSLYRAAPRFHLGIICVPSGQLTQYRPNFRYIPDDVHNLCLTVDTGPAKPTSVLPPTVAEPRQSPAVLTVSRRFPR